jgi:hypothetical protein
MTVTQKPRSKADSAKYGRRPAAKKVPARKAGAAASHTGSYTAEADLLLDRMQKRGEDIDRRLNALLERLG